MKKKNNSLLTLGIIIGIILLAVVLLNLPKGNVEEEIAGCIGERSTLYVQTGCIHCENQLDLFGPNQKYLNIFNCLDDGWVTCSLKGLEGTPTWEINGEFLGGVQSLEVLKQATGC